jgi:YidC/Oxa1 family membrane protein insertase
MVAVMVLSNVLFPPVERPLSEIAADSSIQVERSEPGQPELPVADTETGVAVADSGIAAAVAVDPAAPTDTLVTGEADQEQRAAELVAVPAADTIVVRSPLYEYRLTTRGAALISAQMIEYRDFTEGASETDRVELVRPGDALYGFRVAVGEDTLDLRNEIFEATTGALDLSTDGTSEGSVEFRYPWPGSQLELTIVYRFRADSYLTHVEGRLEGLGDRGYTLVTSLGRGLETNEANPREDVGKMSFAALDRSEDVTTDNLSGVDPGETRVVQGGPFRWVASKSKYFLAAFVTRDPSPGFGGLLLNGNEEENSAAMTASLPVPAGDPLFAFDSYVGPQDYGRLKEVGEKLHNVNPFGWRWLQPVIRPLAGVIIAFLVWMHETFTLAYGWVLILFGILSRIVLFPLYQKSMRAQMSQMHVQPLIKEMQEKYKDDPQKQQKEMMRLYKEHNINPLAGCLPMLVPFPILITLFFVFQNTIEFRGVPFLWLPDLSLKDPLYIVPLLMGGSMLLLSWIGQRGMQSNAQMKVMGYAMPIMFTFLFANFPSGLNLYYATSNLASLPQQLYLSKERRKAQASAPKPGSGGEEDGSERSGKDDGGPGSRSGPPGGRKPPPRRKGRSRRK